MKKIFKEKYQRTLNNKGFSLVELILYIALVSIVLVGAMSFAWNMIFLREKSVVQKISSQNGQIIMTEIKNILSDAQSAQVLGAESLQIVDQSGNTIVLSLNNTVLEKTINGGAAAAVNSNQVEISSLQFTDTSGNNQSKNITTDLEVTNKSASPKFQTTISLTQTTELKSNFNQARSVVIDMSQASLSPNKFDVLSILLENTSSTSVAVTEVNLSWQNAASLTDVLGNNNNLWNGSASTGTQIDITDQSIGASTTIPFQFDFNQSVGNETIDIDFYFNDGSISKSQITLTSSVGQPTPTPAPTAGPTPVPTTAPASCNEVCLNNSYSAGTCRKNAAACNQSGETRVSSGDTYCTGGNNADTCCCAP